MPQRAARRRRVTPASPTTPGRPGARPPVPPPRLFVLPDSIAPFPLVQIFFFSLYSNNLLETDLFSWTPPGEWGAGAPVARGATHGAAGSGAAPPGETASLPLRGLARG